MYLITNNTNMKIFFRDTNEQGVLMKANEKKEVEFPPKNGFGSKLTIEEIKKDNSKKNVEVEQ